jgi:hypothetical protein
LAIESAHRENRRVPRSSVEALRFCATAASELGAVALAPVLARSLGVLEEHAVLFFEQLATIRSALRVLLAAGAPPSALEELATSAKARDRLLVAQLLKPVYPSARPLLRQLAADRDPAVRKAAAVSLLPFETVAWWRGKFTADPLAGMGPREARRYRTALRAIGKLLDLPTPALKKHQPKLVENVARLPDALAIDVARNALARPESEEAFLFDLAAHLLERERGLDALLELFEEWLTYRWFEFDTRLARILIRAKPKVRLAASFALARRAIALASAASSGRGERDRALELARLIGAVAGAAFPPSADPTPIVDLTVPRERDSVTFGGDGLGAALDKSHAVSDALFARMVEAHLAGYPDGWSHLRWGVEGCFLEARPEVLRDIAERSYRGADERVAAWGVARLLLQAYDPKRDPPPYELAGRIWGDARGRRLLLRDDMPAFVALPYRRQALRRGDIGLGAALETLDEVNQLWRVGRTGRAATWTGHGAAWANHMNALLGPEHLRGPETAEERAQYFAIRARWELWNDHLLDNVLGDVARRPFTPADRAFLARAVRIAEEGRGGIVCGAACVLDRNGEAEDLLLLDRLAVLASEAEAPIVERARLSIRARACLKPA